MIDYRIGFNLTVEFISFNDYDWSVKIRGASLNDQSKNIALVYYWSLEDPGDFVNLLSKSSSQGIHSDHVLLKLNFGTVGSYKMNIKKSKQIHCM